MVMRQAPDPGGNAPIYLPAAFAEAAGYTVYTVVARYGSAADVGSIGALVSVGVGVAITWVFRHDIRRI
jgi:predicted exporter